MLSTNILAVNMGRGENSYIMDNADLSTDTASL
jgi:hypothetical protein